jgi:hypothetical protein
MKTYICETKDFKYFEKNEEILMIRKSDKKLYSVHEINIGELREDIFQGAITKICPDFIYNFKEIKKEMEIEDKIDFQEHYF